MRRDSGSVINQKVAYARIQGWPRNNSRRATFAQSMRGLHAGPCDAHTRAATGYPGYADEERKRREERERKSV